MVKKLFIQEIQTNFPVILITVKIPVFIRKNIFNKNGCLIIHKLNSFSDLELLFRIFKLAITCNLPIRLIKIFMITTD